MHSDSPAPAAPRMCTVLAGLHLIAAAAVLVSGAYASSTGQMFSLSDALECAAGRGGRSVALAHVAAGLACTVLALVLCVTPALPPRPGALRALPALATAGAALLGVLGSTLHAAHRDPARTVMHATAGLAYLGLAGLLLVRSRSDEPGLTARPAARTFRIVVRVLLASVIVQVALGALVRHLGAGLSIPDFPLAMGRLVPPLNSPLVVIHFAHRVVAMIVVTLAILVSGFASIELADRPVLGRVARLLAVAVSVQVALGAYVIWWQRDVSVTMGHVVNGGLILTLTVVLTALSSDRRPAGRCCSPSAPAGQVEPQHVGHGEGSPVLDDAVADLPQQPGPQ